jgi:hypothetical protein
MGAAVAPRTASRFTSLSVMHSGALDRFGTCLEQQFTTAQIDDMMRRAGLERIRFSETPCWCGVGYKGRSAA